MNRRLGKRGQDHVILTNFGAASIHISHEKQEGCCKRCGEWQFRALVLFKMYALAKWGGEQTCPPDKPVSPLTLTRLPPKTPRMPDLLRDQVFTANLDMVKLGLVLFTWGNASGVDRAQDLMLIKPSGVDYDFLRPEHLVPVRLSTGEVLDQRFKPSSDTPTHLAMYRAWPTVGGIVHTHSTHATAVAQAGRDIPALGTTHADYFAGDIPCTRPLTQAEIDGAYEANTGAVLIETFAARGLDPLAIPGALISQHAPFAWGATAAKAVYHAAVLERLAQMMIATCTLNPAAAPVPAYLLAKHYQRKHGAGAYYGQR